MTLVMIGTTLDVTSRTVQPKADQSWDPFVVRTVHLLRGHTVTKVELAGRFEGVVPNKGDEVALGVSVRPYPVNQGTAAQYDFIGWENVSDTIRRVETAKAS